MDFIKWLRPSAKKSARSNVVPAHLNIIDAKTVGIRAGEALKTETAKRQLRALGRLRAAAAR